MPADTLFTFHQAEVRLLRPLHPLDGCALKEAPWYLPTATTLAPQGVQSEAVGYSPVADDGLMAAVLLIAVLAVLLTVRSWNCLKGAVVDFFLPRNRSNIYDAATPYTAPPGGPLLLGLAALAEATLLFLLLRPELMESGLPPEPLLSPLVLAAGAAAMALLHSLKNLLYQTVNATFFKKDSRQQWRDGLRLLLYLRSLLLYAAAAACIFFPVGQTELLISAVLVYALCKLLLLVKTQLAFFPQVARVLALFLYFCTLEAVPLLALAAFTLTR